MDDAAVHFATLGPVGYLQPGPGTWGSIAAAILAPFFFTPLSIGTRTLILILLIAAGAYASTKAESRFGCKDPQAVIVDEFAGQLLVFLVIKTPGLLALAAGVGLFRLFDILKPWPVGASEAWFHGGTSVMLDDILAGAYALLALQLLIFLF